MLVPQVNDIVELTIRTKYTTYKLQTHIISKHRKTNYYLFGHVPIDNHDKGYSTFQLYDKDNDFGVINIKILSLSSPNDKTNLAGLIDNPAFEIVDIRTSKLESERR